MDEVHGYIALFKANIQITICALFKINIQIAL